MNIKDYNIILASNSPRRKEILSGANYEFNVYVPNTKETNIIGSVFTEELVKACAENKAKSAYEMLKKDFSNIKILNANEKPSNKNVYDILADKNLLIVAADTVVVNDNIIIGKPKNREDAINTLTSLSNKTHKVVTTICIINNELIKTASETTLVTFKKLEKKQIEDYVDNFKPYDKAGSYGIQDENFDFVKSIDGNLDNVIGFPLTTFKSLLKEMQN